MKINKYNCRQCIKISITVNVFCALSSWYRQINMHSLIRDVMFAIKDYLKSADGQK